MTFVLAEDAALKSALSGMTVTDEKTANRSVAVWFGYPDVEIRDQLFPFVTIDLISISQANDRQHSGWIYDSDNHGTVTSPTSNNFYTYEMPIAYDLVYQITSYSRHPRHDRAIILQLNKKFPGMRGRLAVPNDAGTEVSHRHMFLDSFYKSDRAEGEHGNKRLLRNIYTVRVVSEMVPSLAVNAIPGVTTVAVNKNASGSWTATNVPSTKTTVTN